MSTTASPYGFVGRKDNLVNLNFQNSVMGNKYSFSLTFNLEEIAQFLNEGVIAMKQATPSHLRMEKKVESKSDDNVVPLRPR